VERNRQSCVRSPKESIARKKLELGITKTKIQNVIHKSLRLYVHKIQPKHKPDLMTGPNIMISNNVTYTVTMQLINILSFLLFTTCFDLSRPSAGVSLYAKTVTLY
jgi:hypothetical protein